MEAGTLCDASPSEKAVGTITLIPSMQTLNGCRHHLRDWSEALEAMGGEFEVVEELEGVTLR